jgi:hypothetical protein
LREQTFLSSSLKLFSFVVITAIIVVTVFCSPFQESLIDVHGMCRTINILQIYICTMIVLIDSLRNTDMFSVMGHYYLKILGQCRMALLFTVKCQ